MIRAIMHGCNGKMGSVITDMCENDKDITIVAGVSLEKKPVREYPVYESINEVKEDADVIIDFSAAPAVDALLEFAAGKHMPLVLCTTGLSEEQLEKVNEASENTAILRSANMSLGINVLFGLLEKAAKILGNNGYDIEIVERHHNQKLDAPSGTALALADAVNEGLDEKCEYVYSRNERRQKRPEKEIGISAVRGGSIVGEHEVIFAGTDEVIEFKHTAYSKALFAKGAVEAAKFLPGKKAGIYDMRQVVGLQ